MRILIKKKKCHMHKNYTLINYYSAITFTNLDKLVFCDNFYNGLTLSLTLHVICITIHIKITHII